MESQLDNKPMEMLAELSAIQLCLKNNIKVAKPYFDILGADLLVFSEIAGGYSFARIQCKGRNRTHGRYAGICLPTEYVSDSLIIFVALRDDPSKPSIEYVLNSEDIKSLFSLTSDGRIMKCGLSKRDVMEMNKRYSASLPESICKIENAITYATLAKPAGPHVVKAVGRG
jgi:hypothetical protein